MELVKTFREITSLKNKPTVFTYFSFDYTYMNEKEFVDYSSKYLNLYNKIKRIIAKNNFHSV
ncbi:MAG TPA: hypothetical protein ENH91_03745 [Leeuwenhoekiella sp.]|nr:hypothetical protein [Leeuwenhoekiella sp.]